MFIQYVNQTVAGVPIFLSRDVKPVNYVGVCANMHIHDDVEIIVGNTGVLRVHFESDEMDLEEGDVVIINRRVPHATDFKVLNSSQILLQFRVEKLRYGEFENMNKYLALVLSAGEKDYCFLKKTDPRAEEITELIKKMYVENMNRGKNYEMYVRGYLDVLLGTLYRHGILQDISEHYDRESLRRVWRAVEYIGENYNKEITVEKLASLLDLNAEYFCRIFKKATGVTSVEYINHVRIFKAEKLLTTTNESVLDISLDVGFSSVSYFNRVFKRYRGINPSAYREIIYAKNKLM